MDTLTRTIALDSKNLQGGIEALSSAARAFRLTLFERATYHALMVSVYVTAWGVIIAVVLDYSLYSFEGWRVWADSAGFFGGALLVFGGCLAAVALVLNIPLAARLYREKRRLTELGLTSLSKSLWKARRSGRRLSLVFRWAPTMGFIILLMLAVFSWDTSDEGIVLVLVFSAFFVVLLVLSDYLRNQRERIEIAANAEELKKALQDLQQRAGKSESVSVPSELLEQAARIETAQIAKERKDAVLQSVSVGSSGYRVAFDPAAAEQRRMLDVPDRVELEDVVAQLSIEGPDKLESRAGAVASPEGASRRGETKSKHVEFEYVVDRASRGIRIIAVRRQDHSNGSLKGVSHA